MNINNFISGRERDSFSGYSKVISPFFKNYKFDLPNSSLVDIKLAISTSKKASEETKKMPIDQREDILHTVAKKMKFTRKEIEHFVKMTGMPKKLVKNRLEFAKYILKEIPTITESRYGRYFNTITRPIFDLKQQLVGYESHLPPEEIISAFLPPNDPAEVTFILAYTIMHGGSVLIKPSSLEPYMTLKTGKMLTEFGYPNGGINVVYWNSGDSSRSTLSDEIANNSHHRVFFGSIESLREIFSPQNLLIGKNCFFTAGNSKAIVEKSADVSKAAESIVTSSYGWTIDCISTKSVFVDGELEEELIERILKKSESLKIGSPLRKGTDIGYIENAEKVSKNLESGIEFKYGEKLAGNYINNIQISPYLFKTNNLNFQPLHQEYPYTLTIVPTKDLDDSITKINKLAQQDPNKSFMATSLFLNQGGKKEIHKVVPEVIAKMLNLHTYIVCINKPSTDLNIYLRHQDEFLTEKLTKVLNINI